MNADLHTIRSFVLKKHIGRIVFTVACQLLSTLLILLFAVSLLAVAFAAYPLAAIPFLFDAILLITLLTCAGILVYRTILRRPHLLSTAEIIDTAISDKIPHPLLAIALELSADKKKGELYEEVYRRATKQIDQVRFTAVNVTVPRKRRFTAGIALLFAGCISLVIISPDIFSYWKLPLTMMQENNPAIFPGSISVPEKALVTLKLTSKTSRVPSCFVHITHADNGTRTSRLLRPDSNGVFSVKLDSLRESMVYQFTYGAKKCKPETVTVVPPPLLHDVRITLVPPAYTRLDVQKLPAGQGDFFAYRGTEAQFIITSAGLSSAAIVYGSDIIRLAINDSIATGTLTVKDNGAYSLALCDTFMQRNDSAGTFSIGTITDEPPQIRFLRPGANKNLEPAEIETLLVEATDDLGVQSAVLYWCKNGACASGSASFDISPQQPLAVWQKQFIWKISRLSVYPGDTIFYWAKATDTKVPEPKQSATTDTFWFRFPTFEEMHRQMAQRSQQAGDLIGNALQKQSTLAQNVNQLDKATRQSAGKSWDRQQLAQQVEKTMQAQVDSLQKALDQLKESADRLRKEGTLGEDLAQKMEEIRKAVEELVAQYGDSLLFPKNEAGEISLGDMRKAVDKLQQMLPQLGERLDNTLKYLESLKRDRELAMLAMLAEKLAQEQAQLAENRSDAQAASRQKDLLDRIEALKNDVQKQAQRNISAPQASTMKQIDSTGAQMRSQLSQNQTPSQNTMQQMSANLASLAQQLREQTSAFRMQQMEALRNGLLDMSADFLSMASWQDDIRSHNPSDEASRRKQAQEQQALSEGLGFLRQNLDSLPMLPPSLKQKLGGEINAAQGAAKAAVESMEAGEGGFGMQVSANSLRSVAGSALDVLSAMNQQGSASCQGGGMQESLRKMSGQQAAINAATAQMLRAMLQGREPGGNTPGGGYSGNGQSEQARKEAQAAQQALADELKKLGEKFGDASGEGMRKRVDELEKEARALTRMLDQPREEITEHQDRFLARMLQSALSLHREDEGKEERKSKTSGIIFSKQTGSVSDSASGINDSFHLLRRQALLHGNYPPSYRSLINAYFDSLGVLYLK